MGVTEPIGRPPAIFTDAVDLLRGARLRSEVHTETMPAPRRIAPFAYALSGDVISGDEEVATGRYIVLFDPQGNDSWGGMFRCVTYARADVESDLAADPALPDVGWSWLTDALESHGADHSELSGSVTVVRSEAFGAMEEDGSSAQLEVRASWTPDAGHDLHLHAWAELLCHVGGLPPVEPGVISLPNRRGQR